MLVLTFHSQFFCASNENMSSNWWNMLRILSLTIQGGKNMKKTHIIFQYSTQNTPKSLSHRISLEVQVSGVKSEQRITMPFTVIKRSISVGFLRESIPEHFPMTMENPSIWVSPKHGDFPAWHPVEFSWGVVFFSSYQRKLNRLQDFVGMWQQTCQKRLKESVMWHQRIV